MGQEIRCIACKRLGNAPALLGIIEKGEGIIVLKCKKCKSLIQVKFDEENILYKTIP